jgi:hypothetical protein
MFEREQQCRVELIFRISCVFTLTELLQTQKRHIFVKKVKCVVFKINSDFCLFFLKKEVFLVKSSNNFAICNFIVYTIEEKDKQVNL